MRACGRAVRRGRVPVLVRLVGRGARALAGRRRLLAHAHAEPGAYLPVHFLPTRDHHVPNVIGFLKTVCYFTKVGALL